VHLAGTDLQIDARDSRQPAEPTHEPIVNFMTAMLDPIEPRHEAMVNSVTAAPDAIEPTHEPMSPIAQSGTAFDRVDDRDRGDRVARPAIPLIIDAPAAAATVQHAIAQIEALVAREALASETVATLETDEHAEDTSDSDIPEGFIELDLSTLLEEPPADSPAVREEENPVAIESSGLEDKPFVYDLNVAADAAPAFGESRTVLSTSPASKRTPARKKKAIKDEWAFFDPEKCGFAALLAKLDEIIDKPA